MINLIVISSKIVQINIIKNNVNKMKKLTPQTNINIRLLVFILIYNLMICNLIFKEN